MTVRVWISADHAPGRASIPLIGGDKTRNDRFYEECEAVADGLYDERLEELRKEGLIE